MASACERSSVMLDAPAEWKVRRIGTFAIKVGSGATPRGGKSVYLTSRVSHALIRSQHVFDRRFDRDEIAFITKEHSKELQNVEVRSGDILLNITGDGVTFARACIVPDDILPACVNQHVSIVRVDPNVCVPGYLLAFLTHPVTKQYIESFNSGGSRRAITKGHIESFEVPLPPLPVQRRIAGILSAYDELTENNRRRIRILEAMARALYREWFVRPCQAGELPKGWEEKKIGDVIELAYGKALKAEDRHGGDVPVFGSSGVVGYHHESYAKGPGIVVGRKGNVGSVFWSDTDFWPIDTAFYVVTKLSLPYVYYNLQHQTFINNDAAVPGLSRNAAYMKPFIVPDQATMETFEKHFLPLFGQLRTLSAKNANLRRTRDLLVPRLLSGQVDISVSDVKTGDQAA